MSVKRLHIIILPSTNESRQIQCAVKGSVVIYGIDRGDIIIIRSLLYQGFHGIGNGVQYIQETS